VKTFNKEHSVSDLGSISEPLYWCDLSNELDTPEVFGSLLRFFDVYILVISMMPRNMNRKIAEKRGAIGEFGFIDLAKECIFRDRIEGDDQELLFDVLKFTSKNDRCVEFMRNFRGKIGENIFVFCTEKTPLESKVGLFVSSCFNLIETARKIKYRPDGSIDRFSIENLYLDFLRWQLNEFGICVFGLHSDYSSRRIMIISVKDSDIKKFLINSASGELPFEKDFELILLLNSLYF
jgi:hypothetical protein